MSAGRDVLFRGLLGSDRGSVPIVLASEKSAKDSASASPIRRPRSGPRTHIRELLEECANVSNSAATSSVYIGPRRRSVAFVSRRSQRTSNLGPRVPWWRAFPPRLASLARPLLCVRSSRGRGTGGPEMNSTRSEGSRLSYSGFTFSALGPFGPCPTVNDTRCPSRNSSKLVATQPD